MDKIYLFSKILAKHIQVLSLIIILSTVLIVDRDLINPTVSGKQFWFYMAMGIVSISTLMFYYVNRVRLQLSVVDGLMFLFILLGVLLQFYHQKEITYKLLIFVMVGILYYYLRITCKIWKHAEEYLLLFFVLTGLIEAAWGLGQLYGMFPSFNSMFKITGSFYNPGPYSGYLAITAPVALYSLLKDSYTVLKKDWEMRLSFCYLRWIVSILTLSLIITILPAAMSRASWFATVGGCVFVLLYYLWNEKRYYWYRLKLFCREHRILSFFIALLFFTLICVLLISSYYLKQDSADGRLFMWKISLFTILENPMGVGLGNFSRSYGELQAGYFTSELGSVREEYLAGSPEYAFNEFLQIAVELGIGGMILFLLLIALGTYSMIRNGKYRVAGSLFALLIFASMSYPFSLLPFLIIFVFLLAQCGDSRNIFKSRSHYVPVFLFICFITVAGCLYNRYPTYKDYKEWFDGRVLSNAKIYDNASDIYERAAPGLSDQIIFLFEYAGCQTSLKEYEQSNVLLERAATISCNPVIFIRMGSNYQFMKEYKQAESCYRKAASLIPSRQYPYYLLAKLYHEAGDVENTVRMAEKCLDKQPKIDSPAVMQIKKEMLSLLDSLENTASQ